MKCTSRHLCYYMFGHLFSLRHFSQGDNNNNKKKKKKIENGKGIFCDDGGC